MSNEENKKKFSQLMKRAQTDPSLKERLLNDPALVLQENGIEIPQGFQVRVVRDKNSVSCLVEPKPEAGELQEKELAAAVGGATSSKEPAPTNTLVFYQYDMTEVFIE